MPSSGGSSSGSGLFGRDVAAQLGSPIGLRGGQRLFPDTPEEGGYVPSFFGRSGTTVGGANPSGGNASAMPGRTVQSFSSNRR